MRELIIMIYLFACILTLIPSKGFKITGGVMGIPFLLFGLMVLINGGCVEPFSVPGRIGFFLLLGLPIILLIISIPIHKYLLKKLHNDNINIKANRANKNDALNSDTAVAESE